MSHDNKSKNYPIVLKFGTDVAFIDLQIEFVAQKNRSITKKRYLRLNIFLKIFEQCFHREYLIYRLEILPLIAVIGGYMWLKYQEIIFVF